MTRDIRATRDRLGLSTAGLAKLVGVSYRAAHRWIMGAEVPEPVWRLLERELDVRRFAERIGVGNPNDAIAELFGIERHPGENDQDLIARLEQKVLS
jgi:hypothetical protein